MLLGEEESVLFSIERCPYIRGALIEGFHYMDNYMYMIVHVYVSQRGDSPFVYRDGTGWPASLPYIRKIHVSVAIGTQSGIRLHERVPMVKIWGS